MWHATAAARHRPLPELAAAAILAAARAEGVELSEAGATELAEGLAELPAFPDAAPALDELAGVLPLAVLSNGTEEGLHGLVRAAGLADRFDRLLSVDAVGSYKPAPEVYAMAVEAFGASPESVLLVSSNDWDVAGACQAGLRGVWVSRGRPLVPFLGVEPDLVVRDLGELPAALRPLLPS